MCSCPTNCISDQGQQFLNIVNTTARGAILKIWQSHGKNRSTMLGTCTTAFTWVIKFPGGDIFYSQQKKIWKVMERTEAHASYAEATYGKILRARFCTGLHDPAYNNVIPDKRVECFCDSFGHICIVCIEAGNTIFTNEAHQVSCIPFESNHTDHHLFSR